MKHKPSYEYDNRNNAEVISYMEDRVKAMSGEIKRLKEENTFLLNCLEIYSKEVA